MNENYIREFILDAGFISDKELEMIEEKMLEENLSFLSAILELDILEPKMVQKILNLLEAVPRVKLENKKIPIETLILIPEPVARTKKILAFEDQGDQVFVAVANTNVDYDFIKKFIPEKRIEIFLAEEDDLRKKISEYQKIVRQYLLDKGISHLEKISKLEDFGFQKESDLPDHFLNDIANNYYTEKFIKELLGYAINSNATNIYFSHSKEKVLISFRIFGQNYPIMEIQKNKIFSISLALKKMADINIFEKKEIVRNASF